MNKKIINIFYSLGLFVILALVYTYYIHKIDYFSLIGYFCVSIISCVLAYMLYEDRLKYRILQIFVTLIYIQIVFVSGMITDSPNIATWFLVLLGFPLCISSLWFLFKRKKDLSDLVKISINTYFAVGTAILLAFILFMIYFVLRYKI